MYFSGLEAVGQAYDPFMKGFARAQLEILGLMSRSAQSCLEIPTRLSRCRTPQDLVDEQMRFWRTAFEDYSDSVGRVRDALASFAMAPFGFEPPDDEAESARDYLAFPETKEQASAGKGRDRKAA
jgi:hypothetical protein